MDPTWTIIRDLAKRVRNIADSDSMQERQQLWRDHNGLKKVRPPVMCRVGTSHMQRFWEEQGEKMCATDPVDREIEYYLRGKLMKIQIGDDEVVDPSIEIGAVFGGHSQLSDIWGVPIVPVMPDAKDAERGAWKFNPPLKEEADLEKLKIPDLYVDENATSRKLARARELLDGIFEARANRTNGYLMGADVAYHACFLRDLGQLMYDMIERPEWTHRLMAFLRDAKMAYETAVEKSGDLALDSFTGVSQLCFHCDDLPQKDFDGQHVRLMDLWSSGDSQEFTGVSPDMMDEFLLQYQLPILERFGLNCYGCCESFHNKWQLLKKIPRLRRFSVSPWTNLEEAVANMGPGYVMNWRVRVTDVLSTFTPEQMKQEVVDGLKIAGRCPIEVVLLSIETVPGGLPQLQTWTRMAKQAAEESMQ